MDKYTYTKGRRKTSVATIRLFEGSGDSMLNGKPLKEAVADKYDIDFIREPLRIVDAMDKFYFTAKTSGGGVKSQFGAIRHALSRALTKFDSENRGPLKKVGLLRRDDRMVERKKTGLKKARKAPQFSKR